MRLRGAVAGAGGPGETVGGGRQPTAWEGAPAGLSRRWGIPGPMRTDLPICLTCGVQYSAARHDCPICLDERQYVGWDGQQWTSLAELSRTGHRGRLEGEGPGIIGIGATPPPA